MEHDLIRKAAELDGPTFGRVEDVLDRVVDAQRGHGAEEDLPLLVAVEAKVGDPVAAHRVDGEDGARPRVVAAKLRVAHDLPLERSRLELVPDERRIRPKVRLRPVPRR
eukprot:4271704-Prymnesium_polylepis.1